MYEPNNKSYRVNPLTDSLFFLFSIKDKSMFSYTFYKSSVFFVFFFFYYYNKSKIYFAISNLNRRKLKHMFLKYMPFIKANESVIRHWLY